MRIAVHQPQYWPGLRLFSKMRSCDLFVWLDDVQYEKREFQNRNRIRTPRGPAWLTLPVLSSGLFSQKINEARLSPDFSWRPEHLRSIEQNYARAAGFGPYRDGLRGLYSRPYEKLIDISLATAGFIREALGIEVKTALSSELRVGTSSTARLVDICRAVGADTYLSGAGARAYLDEELFRAAGIKLEYQSFSVREYPQAFPGFEKDLSALDLLLNCGPDSLRFL